MKHQQHDIAVLKAEGVGGPQDRESFRIGLAAGREQPEVQWRGKASLGPRMGLLIPSTVTVTYQARLARGMRAQRWRMIGVDVLVAEYIAVDLYTKLGR